MRHKRWESSDNTDVFRIVANWKLIEDVVWARHRWATYGISNSTHKSSLLIQGDLTWCDSYLESILNDIWREWGLWCIVWHTDFISDRHSIDSWSCIVVSRWHCEILRSCVVRSIGRWHSSHRECLIVATARSLYKAICSTSDWRLSDCILKVRHGWIASKRRNLAWLNPDFKVILYDVRIKSSLFPTCRDLDLAPNCDCVDAN